MSLETIRTEIDAIDTELVSLFVRRMELAKEVAHEKQEKNLPILNRAREREILYRLSTLSGAEFETYTRSLYSLIFDLSRAYQAQLLSTETPLTASLQLALAQSAPFPRKARVACQGVEGAYSQIACDKLFPIAQIMYFKTFEAVFQAVDSGLCDFGILPIENSSYGSVNAVYDLMQQYEFNIAQSVRLQIDHHLLVKPGVSLAEITEVVSHEQALGQCSVFLHQQPQIHSVPFANTARAAQMVAESDRRDLAAIASRDCAALYGLSALPTPVQNNPHNYTRFICIEKERKIYQGYDRISLMLSLDHTPGSLQQFLSRFSALGLNLTKLESRPIEGKDFHFIFYFDFEVAAWSDDITSLINDCSVRCENFAFLGCYHERG